MEVKGILHNPSKEINMTRVEQQVQAVALTSHAVNILRADTPVEEIQVKGRPVVVYTGGLDEIEKYIIVSIRPSGLPIPQVVDLGAEAPSSPSILNIEGVPVEVEIVASGEKIIKCLPPAEEGVIYITSSFTAATAAAQGRRDVYAPRQIVCCINDDGTTTIVGTLGLRGPKP